MTRVNNVLSYLAEPIGTFWDWSVDGEVVHWSTGRTLAFRKEIAEVATKLAPVGLPSFSALLLFIAACHSDWEKSAAERKELADHLQEFHRSGHVITTAKTRLDAIAALPQQFRKGPEAIARLAELFFEGALPVLAPPESTSAAEMLSTVLDPSDLDDHRAGDAHNQVHTLLNSLTRGRGVPAPEKLALLFRTSLETLPVPAAIPTPQAAREIIAALRSQRETAGLGRLAHQLLAAVSVPRALQTAEELPLGGFSDISNRGPLDRLLITELAHDDLTLAVRVATNEALYVRRERPPARPPQRRAIFVDNTIRLWGAPRVFATAVGLAFAGTADPHADFHSHRPQAAGVIASDLLTREGLIAHLESLETSPHAALAVEAWLKTLDKLPAARADAVLITADTAFGDPDFSLHLAQSLEKLQSDLTLFVATVSRSGAFVFLQFSRAGRKIISQATLDLADILDTDPTATPAPKRITPLSADKPVILSIHPLPLLAPWSIEPTRSAGTAKKGAVCLTSDRRVLHWANSDSFARELTLETPRGGILAALHDSYTDSAVFVIKSPRVDRITVFVIDPPRTRQLSLATEYPPVGACVHQGIVYLIYKTRVAAFELDGGKPVGTINLPAGIRWHRDRYFLLNFVFLTLAYDGSRVDLVAIPGPMHPAAASVLELHGIEGPVIMMSDTRLALPSHTRENDRTIVPPIPDERNEPVITAVSPAKDRVLMTIGMKTFMLGSHETPTRWRESGAWSLQSVRLHPTYPRSNVGAIYRHFKQIYIGSEGEFTLVNRRDRHYSISKQSRTRGSYIGMTQKGKLTLPEGNVTFEHLSGTNSFTLHKAQFPRGAVFLDSRGLLHIVPADNSLPQLSMVLCDFQVPLWTSDGQTAGFEKFFAGTPTIPEDQAGDFISDQLARAAEAIR